MSQKGWAGAKHTEKFASHCSFSLLLLSICMMNPSRDKKSRTVQVRTKNKVTQSSFCHCSDTSDRCWVVQITDSLDKKATEKLLLLRKRSLINPSAPWFPHSWWSAAEEMPSRVHAALEWGSKGARTALFPVISHHHQHPHTWPALLQLSRTQLGVFHMCSFLFYQFTEV